MTSQEIRQIRLKHDYQEMLNLKGAIIDWKALRGVAPFIEEYEITVNVRGIIGKGPAYREKHVVKVTLPSNYPTDPPETYSVSTPHIYHPNWYVNGKWCLGSRWHMSESLGYHVLRMIRTIQYDTEITNELSAANSDANNWYVSMKNKGLFPCDKQQLPDPTSKRFAMKITEKKKFEIKK